MLVDPSEDRLHHLTTQLKWRVLEGQGEAIYAIGVEDDGACTGITEEELLASLATLKRMADGAKCEMSLIRRQEGRKGWCAEVLVREQAMEGSFIDMRVAIVGNVDSGKSTIVGVLTSGKLDNGRGLARSAVFRHRHELESGRTSSITQHIMGISASGDIVNYNNVHAMTNSEIVRDSSKVITFIDLAGHERYIKTTVYGMTGCVPDYTMVVVGANMGVQRMTREHLGVALALKCPTFFVVTKVDMCPENVLKDNLDELCRIIKAPGIRKIPLIIKDDKDVVTCAKSMGNDARIAPIFKVRSVTGQQLDPLYAYTHTHTHTHTQVSSVTGQQLDLLRLFLNLIPAQKTQGVYMSVDLFCLYSRSLLTLRKQERTLTRVLYRMCSL
jgi:GTPase